MLYLLWSLAYGKAAGPNPWDTIGLEWMTSSPPPTHNFQETPIVTADTMEFHIHEEKTVGYR
jgi:cytochrome c oxidase subunit I